MIEYPNDQFLKILSKISTIRKFFLDDSTRIDRQPSGEFHKTFAFDFDSLRGSSYIYD